MYLVADVEKYESSLEPTECLRRIQAASELQKLFSELEVSLFSELVDGNIPAKGFQRYIDSLPLSLKKSFRIPLDRDVGDDTKGYLIDLFHFLNANLWNFFDHEVLTSVINRFGSSGLQSSVKKYIF